MNKGASFFVLVIVALLAIVLVGRFIQDAQPNGQETIESEDVARAEIEADFLKIIVPIAQQVYREYGVLPSISIAQAALESDWGTSGLAHDYYNLYGVKGSGSTPYVDLQTAEFHSGQWIEITGRFRVYESWHASVVDHADLLRHGVDWNPELYQGVLNATNYKEAAHALQQAGYATDPTYAEKLIELIESHDLAQYDRVE